MSRRRMWVWISLAVSAASCSVGSVAVQQMTPEEGVGTSVRTPIKAFMADGTIAVFRNGATVSSTSIVGEGTHYSLDLTEATPITELPLEGVVGIEAFQNDINTGATFLASTLGVAAVGIGTVGVLKALFGSCPTFYSFEDGGEILEAEAFSYSIAPLLEGRDIDRLGASPGEDGSVRLELRNEALETHYINHLELLEVPHQPGEEAYPNEFGRILKARAFQTPITVTDRDGRDRTADVIERDGRAFSSSEARMRAVTPDDYTDHIDLTFPRPPGDSAALVLRLRNSLLNTILFYDMMLGSRGAEALDWLGGGMNRIGEAVELGRWFQEVMGLRVSVLGPDGWVPVTRVGDTGPIAWEEIAVQIPVPDTDRLRVRLSFLADEWRIDLAKLGNELQVADDVTTLAIRSIGELGAGADDGVRQRLAEPDEDYLITAAGTAMSIVFEGGRVSEGSERTYFLSSQGYYTEWIRPEWIGGATATGPFRPTRETVVELMGRWLEQRADYEQRFFETRIPVR